MFISISMTAPPTGVLLASSFRCCKVARLLGVLFCEDYPTRVGGRRYSDHMLLCFVIVKNCYLYFLVVLYFLVDSFFFYSQGSYIYSHIYSLYKVSVIFGHSDMFI